MRTSDLKKYDGLGDGEMELSGSLELDGGVEVGVTTPLRL